MQYLLGPLFYNKKIVPRNNGLGHTGEVRLKTGAATRRR